MKRDEEKQRKAHEYLRQHWLNQVPFTKEELQKAAGWSDVAFQTYMLKQFKGLLKEVKDGRFRVRMNFRRFATWESFKWGVVSQKRKYGRDYTSQCFPKVVVFEFFMPLRNEEWLRSALDGLFYAELLKGRLESLPDRDLKSHFPINEKESHEQYTQRVTNWISSRFIGYSVTHVSGRFRARPLMARDDAVRLELTDGVRYLVDETTAVVRFIIPCEDVKPESATAEADLVRWVFSNFFVQTVLEVVDGEDEVWVMESGLRNQLHKYSGR